MKRFEKHIRALNYLLYSEPFDKEAFCWQLKIIRELGHAEIAVYDFVFYNEARKLEARRKKMAALRNNEYKVAASCRDIEKACEDYLAFRRDYPQEKSLFELIANKPSYLHFGTAPNDKQVIEVINNLLKPS